MTQENKDLLLKDLCARLPYGIKFLRKSWNYEWDQELSVIEVLEDIDKDGYINKTKVYNVGDIKPYLLPMSSMTDEQEKEYNNLNCYEFGCFPHTEEALDYLIKNHFDYRGLIENGLALDATGLNIY